MQNRFSVYWRWLLANSAIVLLVDSIIILFSIWTGNEILQHLRGLEMMPGRRLWILPLWWMGALVLRLVPGWGLAAPEQLRKQFLLLTGIFALGAFGLVLSRETDNTSRITFFMTYLFCLIFLPIGRGLVRTCCLRMGLWGVPVVVYGATHLARYAVGVMRAEPGIGYRPVGIFDNEATSGSLIDGIPVIGKLNEHTHLASVALIALPSTVRQQTINMIDNVLRAYRRVIIFPEALESPSLWLRPCDFMGVLGLEVANNLLNPFTRAAKLGVEIFLVIVSMPVWACLFCAISLAILIEDRHSPFYRQKRIGRHGRPFGVIKFRTMVPNAEEFLKRKLAEDEDLRREWEQNCKLKNDPRITRVGRFLRRTSLDEVPQILNVLAFQMSLIGPRPLPDYHAAHLSPNVRFLREQVRPGITGLWQVSGRSQTGTEGMAQWDAYYVRNWSIWLDIVILIRTARVVWRGEGAY